MVIIIFLTEFHYVKKSCKFSTFILSPQYYATSGTACRIVSIMFHSLFHYLNVPEQNISILVQHEFVNAKLPLKLINFQAHKLTWLGSVKWQRVMFFYYIKLNSSSFEEHICKRVKNTYSKDYYIILNLTLHIFMVIKLIYFVPFKLH